MGRLCAERFCQHSAQFGKEQRLFAERGHTGSAGFLFDVCPIVGRQDDDGAAFPDHLADLPHDLDAVHIGDEPVDDVDAEFVALLHGVSGADHRFPAGDRPLRPHPDLGQHGADAQAGVGMPNALIEAMAQGKPCISTKCSGGGAEYLIHDGENGILIDCNDVEACARSIDLLMSDESKRNSLGEKAFEVNRMLNVEVITNRWIDYISEICRK